MSSTTTTAASKDWWSWDDIVQAWDVDVDPDAWIGTAICTWERDGWAGVSSSSTSDGDLGTTEVKLSSGVVSSRVERDGLSSQQVITVGDIAGNGEGPLSAIGVELVNSPCGSAQTILMDLEPGETRSAGSCSIVDLGEVCNGRSLVRRIDTLTGTTFMMEFGGESGASWDGGFVWLSTVTTDIAGHIGRANILDGVIVGWATDVARPVIDTTNLEVLEGGMGRCDTSES